VPTTRKYEVGCCFHEGCSFALFLICKGPVWPGSPFHFLPKEKSGRNCKKSA
jgi:hypothetical protein